MSYYGSYNGMGMNGFRERTMWWKPSSDKERSIFESYKTDVKTFLTICKEGVPVRAAYNQMAEQMEGEIRYQDVGFKNFGEFLFHCQDVLEVRTDYANGYYLFLKGFADEETEHLRQLVQGQAKAKTKRFAARLGNTRMCSPGVLLELLTRPNHLMPPPSTRPSNFRGRGGRGGYRPNRFVPPRLSSFNPGSNGIPRLQPYQPDKTVRPGMYKAVMDQLAPDMDSSDDDDMDDWYWGSSTDVKKSNDGLHSDGEDMVDSDFTKSGFKTPEEITSPSLKSQDQKFTIPEYSAVRNFEPKSAISKTSESKPLCPQRVETKLVKPVVSIIPKQIMTQQLSNSNLPKRLNPFMTKTVTNVRESAGNTVPKLVPYVKKDTSSIPNASFDVYSSQPKDIVTKPLVSARTRPTLPTLLPYIPKHRKTPNEALVKSSMETSKDAAEDPSKKISEEAIKCLPTATTNITNPPKAVPQPVPTPLETREKEVLPPKQFVESINLWESQVKQKVASASPTLPKVVNPFLRKLNNPPLSVPMVMTAETVKIDSSVEEMLSKQMIIPKDKAFNAKLVGADGFGFLLIHLDEYNINKCFDRLQKDLDEFYFSGGTCNAVRISQSQLQKGLLVAARVGNHFCRARIFEFEKDGLCLVVNLEDHEFAEVPVQDIYQLDKRFARPLPRAIKCKLADISDDHMLTDEFTNAFEETPLCPPNVLVKFIHANDFYGVPEVSLTLESTGKDVASLIMFHAPSNQTHDSSGTKMKDEKPMIQELPDQVSDSINTMMELLQSVLKLSASANGGSNSSKQAEWEYQGVSNRVTGLHLLLVENFLKNVAGRDYRQEQNDVYYGKPKKQTVQPGPCVKAFSCWILRKNLRPTLACKSTLAFSKIFLGKCRTVPRYLLAYALEG
ncbi:unnamed protein product [Allacma fusca]|uniref:Tudor domain-containing protein n=1 Tax=Allacma fusca TaxID=39272 RepID=A0A8J2Q1D5_9HEXA|nr:unnamed protein product [Allacma fusca]